MHKCICDNRTYNKKITVVLDINVNLQKLSRLYLIYEQAEVASPRKYKRCKNIMNTLTIVLLALAICSAQALSLPDLDTERQLRIDFIDFYRNVDAYSWKYSYQWSSNVTGTVNTTLLQILGGEFYALLAESATSTLRQCDRMNENCYVCANGALQIATATVGFMAQQKLFGQHRTLSELLVKQIGDNRYSVVSSFSLHSLKAPANFAVNSYPAGVADSALSLYFGELEHQYVSEGFGPSRVYKIDRISTGLRFAQVLSSELGGRLLTPAGAGAVFGPMLPSDAVFASGNQGLFCGAF